MRAMGLDVGQRRIGVALSDPSGRLAYSRGTLRRSKLPKDLDELAAIASEEGVSLVVVGLPRNLDGTLGPQAERVQRFGALLAERLSLPVVYWDERLTTVAAQRELREAGVPARARRESVDAVAAAMILQGYLDYLANQELRSRGEVE